ncbi:MAG TPA: hypothetical protein VFQ53_31740 [Kofleriaceae bacterium]|nr:hypothetical protein [Kofleriaceae bacterium]
MEPALRPPRLVTRRPRRAIACGIAALAAALWVGRISVDDAAPLAVVPVVSPVQIAVPAQPPPEVTVQVPPAPEPPPPPPAEPRRLQPSAPFLDAACLVPRDPPAETGACTWDAGFPAISGDGATIAVLVPDGPEAADHTGWKLRFFDATSGRTLREHAIVTMDEANLGEDVPHDRRDRAVARRAAALQHQLDAGGYRSLVMLGARDGMHMQREAPPPPADRVYAEIDGDAVRIVDPTTATVKLQRRFVSPNPHPGRSGEECSGWTIASATVWWDEPTRRVLVAQVYLHGGCMCGSDAVLHVAAVR